MTFEEELGILINKHSLENESDTPDFALAEYVTNCLAAFATVTLRRDVFHGRDPRPVSRPPEIPKGWTQKKAKKG